MSASQIALQLAQDRKFLERVFSAIGHVIEAGLRIDRALGGRGAVARLATDEAVLGELRRARRDLERARERLRSKRRSRKLRNVMVFAALAFLAVPWVRGRIAAIARAFKLRQRLAGLASPDQPTASDESPQRPRSLEDLTKEELYARAQDAEIPSRSEMSKEQLIQALRARG